MSFAHLSKQKNVTAILGGRWCSPPSMSGTKPSYGKDWIWWMGDSGSGGYDISIRYICPHIKVSR